MNGPVKLIESGLWRDILLSKTLPAAVAAARRLKADTSWKINIEANLFWWLGYTFSDATYLASSVSQPSR